MQTRNVLEGTPNGQTGHKIKPESGCNYVIAPNLFIFIQCVVVLQLFIVASAVYCSINCDLFVFVCSVVFQSLLIIYDINRPDDDETGNPDRSRDEEYLMRINREIHNMVPQISTHGGISSGKKKAKEKKARKKKD